MSSRRNGSVSRAAEAASKSRLHMDRNPQHSRITDPSNPAGRRKEIDNVMKRARQASPGSWDRKLLEVEEKDPGRWRHTGYKQMYLKSRSSSPRSPRRSRSPPPRRSRTPLARRSRSPLARRTRSPLTRRSRSPIRRSPPPRRSRSPVVRRSRSPRRESRSPRRSPRRSPIRRTPPPRRAIRPRSPPPRRPSPRPKPRPPPPRTAVRPPSPPQPPPQGPSSGSGSSVSTCSDESCSVCSAKNKKGSPREPPKPPKGVVIKPRAPSGSPGRSKRPPPPGAPPRAVQPTRELLKAREASKRSREEKVLEWQRSQLNVARPPIPPQHIKREGERRRRGVSPAAIAAALASGSDEESEPNIVPPPRLTLSERFGKMAAWSAARSARLENMRITRRDSALHVHIEGAEAPAREEMEEAPVGSYPEELLAVAPAGLSWDDVRVRYDYYKKRGYLRGLTLSDYVKWEDWWYKYQEWLKRERAYERWAEGEVGSVRRERRRRGGRHRRS